MGGPSTALLASEGDSGPTPGIPCLQSLDETSLLFVINHVFLPPALPTKSDRTPEHEASLIRVFKDCAEKFARHFEPQSNSRRAWDVVSRMLAATALLHDRGIVEEEPLDKQIADMGLGDVVPVYVAAQNAVIILRRPINDQTIITLESFEVYPPAAVVTRTEGKLRIVYPSVGRLSIPIDHHVRKSLSQFISFYALNPRLDAQVENSTRTQNTKDPQTTRDSPSPKYITELLTGIVRAMSEKPDAVLAQTVYISKRIDDHILCERNAEAPWRRSPLWLIIRVAIQTTLCEWNVEECASFKTFMLYALSSILHTALHLNQPDHLLFVMNAKLARRFCKMPDGLKDGCFAMDGVATVNKMVADELEKRWKAIQKQTTRQLNWSVPTKEEIINGARVDLLATVPYLKEVKHRDDSQPPTDSITKSVVPSSDQYATRYNADLVSPPNLANLPSSPLETTIRLYDFEQWVARQNGFSNIDMLELTGALNHYTHSVLSHYNGDPERLSVAFLTMIELWIGIDEKVIEWEPYLKNYTPEIPSEVLEPLLLPRRDQMQRLSRAEIYLQKRHKAARIQSTIFYDTTDSGSFANWFVNQSQSLQATLQEIKDEAQKDEEEKLAEMTELNDRYRDLMQKIGAAVCPPRNVQARREWQTEHPYYDKCSDEKELKSIELTSFERPLPNHPIIVKCVAFELRLPRQFSLWRDATAIVLSACSGGITEPTNGNPLLLSGYTGYKKWFIKAYPDCKLTLAAYRNEYNTSYRPPISKQDAIQPHSMGQYRVLSGGGWGRNPFFSSREASSQYLHKLLTMKLDPTGPYCSLQPAVSSTTHTSNDVIASQSSCPESITLHDHEAFGHIRAGHKLQWRSMLRELRRGILNISHKDVYLLFLQAMWQAGPKSEGNEWRRESHVDGDEAIFGLEAVQEMEAVLDGIQDSRAWAYGCGVLIAMAARILSLTDKPKVRATAIDLLIRMRHVIHKWLKEVNGADGRTATEMNVADEAEDGAVERTEQTLLLAILGCSTFDVDDEHIDHVFQSAQDVSLLVECRYTIYMNTPPVLGTLPFSLRILYHRDQVLAIRLLPRLSARIRALPGGESGIDEGIKSIWHGYMPTGRWRKYGQDNRWYSTRTAAGQGSKSLEVYFNLLDGALYGEHKMFGKLPGEYTRHMTYRRLFGESRVLEVGPSDMPNMEYQTKKPVCGWQVHFKLDSNDLVVRSYRDDEVFELIPESKFISVLPHSFIHDYFHWYNMKTQIVEFRPLADRWTPNLEKNWSTAFQLNGGPVLSRQQEVGVRQFLVAPDHALGRTIHNIFSPLEPNIFDLLITFRSTNHNTQPLSISLPRFNLAFAVTQQGELGCLSHRGFILDSDQDIGTLYGLSNKLVLCRPSKFGRDRKVIIPIGSIRPSSTGVDHPNVSIDTAGDARSIRYRVYEVDELLGRLREATFSDRLYRLYLHALTSHQLVDPLTKRTGTEEALEGLMRAGSFSFQALGGEDFKLLQRLGQLTPHRSLYPREIKTMQVVKHHVALPPTLEHHDFAEAVRRIWSHWQNIRVFHAESQGKTQASDDELLSGYRTEEHQQMTRRAAARSFFYSPSWSDPPKSRAKDSNYAPRDCMGDSGSVHRETLAFEMAKLVQDWPASLDVTAQLPTDVKKWGRVDAYNPELTLDYGTAWVEYSLFQVWRSLYDLCRFAKKETDQSNLTFLLGTLAYLHPDEHHLHTTFLAFATRPQFARLAPPDSWDLDFGYRDALNESQFRSFVTSNTVQFEKSSEYDELKTLEWTPQRENTFRSRYESRLQQQIDECVSRLVQLRCHDHVSPSVLPSPDLIKKEGLSQLNITLKHCYQNRSYFEHLQLLQNELDRIKGPAVRRHLFAWAPLSFQIPPERYPFMTWSMLLSRPPSRTSTPLDELLESCFDKVGDICTSPLQQQYSSLLEKSKIAHAKRRHITSSVDIEHEYCRTSAMLDGVWGRIIECLGVLCEKDRILARAGLWPRLSPRDILDKLAISQRSLLSESWKAEFIKYAEEVTMVQRACRISRLTTPDYRAELERELSNSGRIGWDAMSYPDWLLIELETNILIRQVQAEIAIEMLAPSSGENTVVQLNMGEGKSSVIVPIVSAALANRSQIVRVVVLKPLTQQMFHLLCRTLSGLTNRRIFYIPIDRSLRPDAALAKRIHNLFVECMETGGILLCQPEHILSFKLMAFEALSGSQSLLSTQRWLEENARDILDESDEILSPKYQLIYTMGTQHSPDGESMRWKIAQGVFNLIRVCARDGKYEGSLSVNGSSPQQFPQIRVFTQDCGQRLLCHVAKCIVFENLLHSFSFRRFSAADRTTLFHFITETIIDRVLYNQVMHICQNQGHSALSDSSILEPILLLRGLLGHGILLTVLKEKRWRVDYGLDLSRSMLAVPYRAKDSPSPRAEFGHTDVAICFTCLSYYYEGLTDPQLADCFEQLFKTDNPNQEYEHWIKDYRNNLPKTLRSLQGLNLGDPVHRHEHIFPQLRYCKAVIDFFLSTIVFPKYMKEFPHKLSTSGWDLAHDRSSFGQLVTGFSGTNDNRFLLPQMIGQVDLEAHTHTNAMGLDCILRQENSKVIHLPDAAKDIRGMLEHLRDEEADARVLLDVGAQVLELQNKEVAALWLEVDPRPEIEAAVFVDSKDDLQVLRRDGVVELLVSSPYIETLGRCVVYLDEAHTRGMDLKLPPGSRAVVTLGPRLYKDKLLQGCMRMRKLGSTHSVCFLVSTEVAGYIAAANGVANHQMMSKHVLKWTIQETIAQLRTYAPLWAHQGCGFDDRNRAWERYKEGSASAGEFISILKDKESFSLQELYGMSESVATSNQGSQLKIWIQDRCKEFDVGSTNDARMREEQEREVSQEKEEQRQINRLPPAVALRHTLRKDVRTLVSTGSIPIYVKGILSARRCLLETTLKPYAERLKKVAFPHIFVTEDFARTIETTVGYISNTSHTDDFLRPVQWVLSSRKQSRLVLLSPFEANALVDQVRKSRYVTLHIYAPRTSRNMRSFDDLRSFMVPHRDPAPAIPANIISELNLFAGQLYFASKLAYEGTRQMLGLYLKDPPAGVKLPPGAIDATGFVRDPSVRKVLGIQHAQCTDNPVAFLRKLTELRRKGQGFLPTHVGQMLHSRDIPDDEFD